MMGSDLRYPRYDLESSLQVAQVLRDKGGGEASATELATFLGYKSTKNGAFLSRVAAARMFGFIEGPSSGLRVTDAALEILTPDYPETEMRARLRAFENVPLFGAFLSEYEGQPLPGETGMRNALSVKFGIPGKTTPLALARLLESADQAGLFRVAGSRKKLVRPTIAAPPPRQGNGAKPDGKNAEAPPARRSEPSRYPKLIEGALETVPWDGTMAAEEIDEWCEFFKAAMKVHFRLRT